MDDYAFNLFGGTISTLSRSLDLRARQQELILGNVANADTPNYTPFSINVEKALQEGNPANASSVLTRTDEKHLSGEQSLDDSYAEMDTTEGGSLLLRGDKNGVDIDVEMTRLAENGLLYKTSTQIVGAKFSGLKNVIKGGSK
ncbi:flagellar basal body rod protein FlgB [Desulfosarcina ovata subsp. sediminis]|uniref:Flagellar basal body rod protein FlgB n=1 Tax=Desulfosarcina ovata subsp. sediminis TaxID=885957 RepID=A0A5K7ZFT8_9BACT|nr:flagellar basal body rod protein FlgB [Desulfosarcina ovata]BBO79791.1 flagellar basal body rod protein FlgB [Desulfosarcina ovata subsp. sediminis]